MENQPNNTHITLQASRIMLPSQVQYDIEQVIEDEVVRPKLLGAGRFAKVYAAHQWIAGRPSRPVALKVLHDNAGYQDEPLFSCEIALNREFAGARVPGIAPLLDVILLGPLVLCGCGVLYHPMCPRGCGVRLERIDIKGRLYPALSCGECDYELSAEFVPERGHELTTRLTKTCCTRETDPHADEGTIINFALREVMIMESLERNLADHCVLVDFTAPDLAPPTRLNALREFFGLLPAPWQRLALEQQVRLLGKVNLMVQIGETVVWLHERMQVVHKDLAPDNVMVIHTADPGCAGTSAAGDELARILDSAANPSLQPRVIDFGLSDKEKLTRSWYEDADTSLAATKLPYLSPEARYRRQSIGTCLEFDRAERRFRIPAGLAQSPASIRVGDIIADRHDHVHANDITIARIDGSYAYFEGSPPKALPRHLEIIRPLGEAHDVYALGAILYYILTGRHDQVEYLSNFVGAIQDQPCPLVPRKLARRDNYGNRRNSIHEPFFRDELMLVILRAMVRGLPESFVRDRTERGSGPARKFTAELKLIQQKLIAEVFAARNRARDIRLRRAVGAIGLLCVLASTILGVVLALRGSSEASHALPPETIDGHAGSLE